MAALLEGLDAQLDIEVALPAPGPPPTESGHARVPDVVLGAPARPPGPLGAAAVCLSLVVVEVRPPSRWLFI